MNIINKLDRKFHGKGIPNLTVYILCCYALGYILQIINPTIINKLSLNVTMILRGEVWRLVSWILIPPQSGSVLLFVLAILLFYYPIGTSLEHTWGTFRYNLYIFNGVFLTIVGAFILHFVSGGLYEGHRLFVPNDYTGIIFTTYYISLSVFLAYAACFPDMRVYLYFVLPIKVQWMAIFYLAIISYNILQYIRAGVWFMAIPIVASLLNFGLFYLASRNQTIHYSSADKKRRNEFRKAMSAGQVKRENSAQTITKHKCVICGRTEVSNPELEFRFCSRCNGNYEYCQDHLFTHEHK
ncbi:MAG: hypothetical protein Q4B47_02830 [Eubacteriales bacterium]|nr:hypothetical protein [Eubacteriales bacterium]